MNNDWSDRITKRIDRALWRASKLAFEKCRLTGSDAEKESVAKALRRILERAHRLGWIAR